LDGFRLKLGVVEKLFREVGLTGANQVCLSLAFELKLRTLSIPFDPYFFLKNVAFFYKILACTDP
jgi:hypothetical protein